MNFKVALDSALQKVLGRSKKKATSRSEPSQSELSQSTIRVASTTKAKVTSDKPPAEPSQSVTAIRVASSSTKAKDLLAFRTIMTMLSSIQSSPDTTMNGGTMGGNRKELRVLDAMSAVLIRRHEITAVVAQPYNGSNLQVIASVVYPSNAAEPLLQAAEQPELDGHGQDSEFDPNFTVSTNPRSNKINGCADSLINLTSLPLIGNHQDRVPEDLVTAADSEIEQLLNIFLKNHWHRESFETHAWMVKTLLGRSAESQKHLDTFLLYIIAVSFQKMNSRMTNKRFSAPYYNCLQSQTTFTFRKPPSTVQREAGGGNHDKSFVESIDFLASKTKIPNLRHAALLPQPFEIYNESTYMEFHFLLCELLNKFRSSLGKLVTLQRNIKEGKCDFDLEIVLEHLKTVRTHGHYLRRMVRSSAIETHLQSVAPLLVVDTRKSWAPEPEEDIDSDIADFQRFKPYSTRKGKPLSPWESYRDWLRLMVHYFDAAEVLTTYVKSRGTKHNDISIVILSPPLPDKQMLSWTELLETERFFPTRFGEISGKDFVKFLTITYDTDSDGLVTWVDKLKAVVKLAEVLINELESGRLASPDSLTKIDALAQQLTSVGQHDAIGRINEQILDLKDSQPQDQPARMQTIVDMLNDLVKRASFYYSLKQGSLHSGEGFFGKYHCEAYTASLITLLGQSGQNVGDFEEGLNMLSAQEIKQIEKLLIEIKSCRHAIGVSKRCCPVCAFLLSLLNKHYKTEFVISDVHSNITACALPEWLPGDIVHLMVVEFSRRLREELRKLQESISELRRRAGTSDTGRISMDSVRTLVDKGPEYADEFF